MNKLQPNQNHRLDNITKLQSPKDKMILLNLINQEHNKSIHYLIEKDKFKSVLNQINKQSNKQSKLYKSIELHKSSESYESNSEFIMKTEIVEIENHNFLIQIYI